MTTSTNGRTAGRGTAKPNDLCTVAQAEVIANHVAQFYAMQVPSMIEQSWAAMREQERMTSWRGPFIRAWRRLLHPLRLV